MCASRAQRFELCAGLLRIGIALRERFLRELRGQVASEFFKLRRKPPRQVSLQRFRGGILRNAVEAGGFFANLLQRRGDFAGKYVAVRRKLLLPFLGGNSAFGRNGLRSGFARGRVDLFPRISNQPGDLPRELHSSVRGARRGREGAQPFRVILWSAVGVGQGQFEIPLARQVRRRFVGLFASFGGVLRPLRQIRSAWRFENRL